MTNISVGAWRHLINVLMPRASACFQETQDKVISPEKAEEAKLKARYPNLGNKPGGSDLLRKRLQKGVSYLLDLFVKPSESSNAQFLNRCHLFVSNVSLKT